MLDIHVNPLPFYVSGVHAAQALCAPLRKVLGRGGFCFRGE